MALLSKLFVKGRATSGRVAGDQGPDDLAISGVRRDRGGVMEVSPSVSKLTDSL
jgi:hypothetical protein